MPKHDVATPHGEGNMVVEILKYTIIALAVVIPIRVFVAQPFIVSGDSMDPTFAPREYLVVDQLSYRFHEPQRGDVVIFRYPLDPSIFFIKRVVGLPGETLHIERGIVTIKGVSGEIRLDEPYRSSESLNPTPIAITLANDEYYVLGDNRRESSDSREWGPLQRKFITGRAFARILPLSRAGIMPGHYEFDSRPQ